MAAKVIFILALIAFVVKADSDCNCDEQVTKGEKEDVWNYLRKLSDELDESDAEDMEMRAVLPGVLSPLVECNCLEKNRRKRKTVHSEEVSETQSMEKKEKVLERERKYIHFKTKHCAKGYVWYAVMCVKEEVIKYLK